MPSSAMTVLSTSKHTQSAARHASRTLADMPRYARVLFESFKNQPRRLRAGNFRFAKLSSGPAGPFEGTNTNSSETLYLQYPRSLVDGAGSQRFLCRARCNCHCRCRRVARGDGGHDARIGDSQPVDAVYE
jgi:hypothetical protein